MKKMKKILCLCLALAMCLSLVNVAAFAVQPTYQCDRCDHKGPPSDFTGNGNGTETLCKGCQAGGQPPEEQEKPDPNKCPQIDENGNHKHDASEVLVGATCCNEGEITYYCAHCKDGYGTHTETIPALTADYTDQKWEPAGNGQHKMVCRLCNGGNSDHVQYSDCEDKDNNGKCDYCGDDVAQVETPCEHNMVWEITDNPTCTQKGNQSFHCTKCDYVEQNESIDPLGHEWGPWTHTDDSLKHFRYCKRDNCDCGYNAEPVSGTHANWEHFTKEPTCTEDGYTEKKCPDCGYTETTVIPATEHTCDQVDENGKHKAVYLVTKEPTCTEKGAAQWWCPSCKTVFENVEVPAKGHRTKIVVVNAPTCTEKGNEHEVCTVCGAIVENKENSALGHDWGDWQSDGQKGHYQVCNRCKSHSETVDHSFGAWETVREATATEEGVERHVCNNCDYTETRNTSVIEGQDPGNQGGNEPTRYTLTINYRYADGTEAAAQYSQEFESNASYNVVSPVIAGYSPDVTQVIGEMTDNVTVTVTYSRIVDIDEEDPPLTETPGDRDPIVTNPETDIPDEQPPLVELPDEEPPLTDLPDEEPPLTDLPDEEPPLVELPDEEPPLVDLPDEQPPLTDIPMEQPILAEQVEVDISDDPTPLANVPQTGDISLVWYVAAAMSAMGLTVLTLKKREDEKD